MTTRIEAIKDVVNAWHADEIDDATSGPELYARWLRDLLELYEAVIAYLPNHDEGCTRDDGCASGKNLHKVLSRLSEEVEGDRQRPPKVPAPEPERFTPSRPGGAVEDDPRDLTGKPRTGGEVPK